MTGEVRPFAGDALPERGCVRGCCVLGEHVSSCGDDACRGCVPRDRERGFLCLRCWGRLCSAVRTLPALVDHLLLVAVPSVGAGASSGARRAPGSRCLYPVSAAACDELLACLHAWCEAVADALQVTGPHPAGMWLTDSWVKVDPATGETYVSESVAVGAHDPSRAARQMCAWLDSRLPVVAERDWVSDFVDDFVYLVERAQARWPVQESVRRVTDVDCPRCGARSLRVFPPLSAGQPELVKCSRVECRAVLGEEEWERVRSWALLVARMDASLDDDGGDAS